jgi:hypothetical protein
LLIPTAPSSSSFLLHVKTKEFWPYRTRAPVVDVIVAEKSHCSSDLGRISHSIRKGTKFFRQLFGSELALAASFSCARPSRDKKERKKKERQQSAAASKGLTPTVWVWNGSQKKMLLHAEQTSVSMPRVRAAVSALPFRRCLPACRVAEKLRGGDMGPVWFSFFLTSFSENLAVGRIWLWEESEYHYDYVWRKIKFFIGLRI